MTVKPRKAAGCSDIPGKKQDMERIDQIRKFAALCQFEREHSEQVTRLALQLFDQLQPVHRLDSKDRFLLECGAILHDIGWIQGQQRHHKTSLQMILQDTTMPLNNSERAIIGLVARYHRKGLPKQEHPLYGNLSEEDRRRVEIMAGILRIADGLDRTHRNRIDQVEVRIADHKLTLFCRMKGPAAPEMTAAQEKASLLRRAVGREIEIFSV